MYGTQDEDGILPKPNLSTSFLPDVRKAAAESAEAFNNLSIECNICYLSIHPNCVDTTERCGDLFTLACGHMFGPCIKEWRAHYINSFWCPVCRQGTTTRRKNVLYTIRSAEDVLRSPLCLSEGGVFPETAISTTYFDYGTISDKIEEVLLRDVLSVEGPLIPEDVKKITKNMGMQITTETTKTNGKMYAREKLKSKARLIILVQTDWDKPKTTIWECVDDGRHAIFLSKVESACVSIKNGRLVTTNQAKWSDYMPRAKVPIYATQNGYGLLSNVLKKANKDINKVWTAPIVGFGIGFLDQGLSEVHKKNLAEAMASSTFELAMCHKLSAVVKMYTRPEAESTLIGRS